MMQVRGRANPPHCSVLKKDSPKSQAFKNGNHPAELVENPPQPLENFRNSKRCPHVLTTVPRWPYNHNTYNLLGLAP